MKYEKIIKAHKVEEKKQSITCIVSGLSVFAVVYGGTNFLNSLRDFHYYPYMDWELATPIIPWMITIYFATFITPLLCYFFLPANEHKPVTLAMLAAMIFSCAIFLIFPTKIGFSYETLPEGIFSSWFKLLWAFDYPHNLVPSLHVVVPGILLAAVWRRPMPPWFKFSMLIFIILISASTQFTHQHHLIDIIAAQAVIYLSYRFVFLKYAPRIES